MQDGIERAALEDLIKSAVLGDIVDDGESQAPLFDLLLEGVLEEIGFGQRSHSSNDRVAPLKQDMGDVGSNEPVDAGEED